MSSILLTMRNRELRVDIGYTFCIMKNPSFEKYNLDHHDPIIIVDFVFIKAI